ncbi:MAG: GTPase Era [Actinomycetota bacterium]
MSDHRSGLACFVGRPNAGKSTLTNAIVGTKVAITSSRPQTTRHVVRGILTRPDAQLVILDTPGLHKPRTLLGERLNDLVREAWSTVDVAALCVSADAPVGTGDSYVAAELARARGGGRRATFAVVTKTDLVSAAQVAQRLAEVADLGEQSGLAWAEVVPVSAVTGNNVDLLTRLLIERLPPGPVLYPDGEATDEPEETLVAEFIREAALEGVTDEVPHSIAVVIEEMAAREDRPQDRPLVDIYAVIFVERDSQKAIVIGKGGSRLKQVGIKARRSIEALLGTPVYLDLRVKVAKDWQRDPKQLRRLGF